MLPRIQPILQAEIQSSDSATKTIRLPGNGFLHTLFVTAKCTNGATGGRAVSMRDVIDLVEIVVDGSHVLFSMTLQEIEKYYEWRFGNALPEVRTEAAGGVQQVMFPICFGRKLFDPEMYLPLSGRTSAELRITYSPAIAADGGFATGTTTFDVQAYWSLQQPGAYVGTLVNKTVDQFTSVASGDYITEHSRAHPIRGILIYAYEAATADGTDIGNVNLRVNSGEYSIVNADWDYLQNVFTEYFNPKIVKRATLLLTNNETFISMLGSIDSIAFNVRQTPSDANDTFKVWAVDGVAGDTITFAAADADITAGAETFADALADSTVDVILTARNPGNSLLIPFDYSPNPDEWLQSGNLARLETILTQSGAGAAVKVSVEELQVLSLG